MHTNTYWARAVGTALDYYFSTYCYCADQKVAKIQTVNSKRLVPNFYFLKNIGVSSEEKGVIHIITACISLCLHSLVEKRFPLERMGVSEWSQHDGVFELIILTCTGKQ